jgi:hypothetical protein
MQRNNRPGGDGIDRRAEIWILCVCAAITLVEAVVVDADIVDSEGLGRADAGTRGHADVAVGIGTQQALMPVQPAPRSGGSMVMSWKGETAKSGP